MPTGLTSLQILLLNRNHWVVALASGNADSADVILYDSKYSLLHEHTRLLLSQLVFTKNKYFTVGIANVNKQSGDNDCGLFAAAYITSIAHGQDPSSIVYNQGLMREHLLTCLETKRMALFPTIRERRVLQSKIVKTEVYCYCRSPNDKKKEMVRSGQMTCKEWFHFECIGTDNNIVATRTKMVL